MVIQSGGWDNMLTDTQKRDLKYAACSCLLAVGTILGIVGGLVFIVKLAM